MKDFVSLNTKICIHCNKQFEVGVLLNRNLSKTLERNTITGVGLCDDCKKEGYTLLVEVDPTKSEITNNNIRAENAYRTGNVLYLKNEAFTKIFNAEPFDFAFISENIFNALVKLCNDGKGNS